jgi:hypothetical protein
MPSVPMNRESPAGGGKLGPQYLKGLRDGLSGVPKRKAKYSKKNSNHINQYKTGYSEGRKRARSYLVETEVETDHEGPEVT